MHNFEIRAEQRTYRVIFETVDLPEIISIFDSKLVIAVIDSNLQALLSEDIKIVKARGTKILLIEANEEAKEMNSVSRIATAILDAGLSRNHTLLAVGGGITQDIVSFCASICLRGVDWAFVPTTLLAQADSCIGSKTSINLGARKNALGTYWPPVSIFIDQGFLPTLDNESIRAGIGEMLKVHAIKGLEQFDSLTERYKGLFENQMEMLSAIHDSLSFKKEIVEVDERDAKGRLVMNYGHTFGHAIEVSSNFQIQHGIAVTLGCDVANFVAWQIGKTSEGHYRRMHDVLMLNAGASRTTKLDFETYESAIRADKKHDPTKLVFVMPDMSGRIVVTELPRDSRVIELSKRYIEHDYSI